MLMSCAHSHKHHPLSLLGTSSPAFSALSAQQKGRTAQLIVTTSNTKKRMLAAPNAPAYVQIHIYRQKYKRWLPQTAEFALTLASTTHTDV